MPRHSWDDLPAVVRAAVERETGAVFSAESPSAGRNSDFSAVVHAAGGIVFCKGIEGAAGRRGRMHRHEADINQWLPPAIAPRLLWRVVAGDWLVLGFERVPGRYADLSPGSADLPLVAGLVDSMADGLARCPGDAPRLAEQWARLAAWRRIAQRVPGELDEWVRRHLDDLIAWERVALEVADGDNLVHTDLHPLNILVDGNAARAVDWAWSRKGNPAVDVAFLGVRLVMAGHQPSEAQEWAEGLVCWARTPSRARTALAVAVWGIWEYMGRTQPSVLWAERTNAARAWALHRQI
ncbi:phosphotransferase family protein [Actinokineospora sp. G85]|uniref:phosphotransferase family protein n=1 Tax=Actinokineospora sp. G85 TaxID=3406626 RepID=UPI003C708B0C